MSDDAYEFECPEKEELHGGGFIEEEGWYHIQITEFIKNPMTKAGEPMNGFKIGIVALAGTAMVDGVFTQKGRSTKLLINQPSEEHRDGGEFARRVMGALFVSTCLVKPGTKSAVNRNELVGRQCFVKLKKNDGDFLNIDGLEIYHVDAPEVAKHPRDEAMIAKIPEELRRKRDDGPAPDGSDKPDSDGPDDKEDFLANL